MKRKKMNFHDFEKYGVNYIAFQRVKRSDGLRGYRYILEKSLTPEQVNAVKAWHNVTTGECSPVYAPEIKHGTIILWDKCIK